MDKPKALAGRNSVAIAIFRVEFAVENNGKASSSSNVGTTTVKADILLQGIDDATRQSIADRLYDDFVADLMAAGIQVVPYETVAANEDYQSLAPRFKKTYEPVGTQIGKSVFVGPHAMPVYFTNDDKHLGVGATLGSLSTTQPQKIEPQIAESLDTPVLRVTMNIQFAEQKSSGGMITLEDAKSKGDKTAAAIGNVITGLATGITRKVKRYNANATPEAYADGIVRYGDAYYKAVAHAIRANAGA